MAIVTKKCYIKYFKGIYFHFYSSPQSDRKWNPEDSHVRVQIMQRKIWKLVYQAIERHQAKDIPEMPIEKFRQQEHKCWDARNYYVRGANNAYTKNKVNTLSDFPKYFSYPNSLHYILFRRYQIQKPKVEILGSLRLIFYNKFNFMKPNSIIIKLKAI